MKSNNNLQIEIARVVVCFQKEQLIPLICLCHMRKLSKTSDPIAFLYKNKQNQPRETKQWWTTCKSRGTGVNVSVEVIGYGSKSLLNVVLMAY